MKKWKMKIQIMKNKTFIKTDNQSRKRVPGFF